MFVLRSARGRAILAGTVLILILVGMGALAVWRTRDMQHRHHALGHTAAAATALEGAQAGFWQAQGALSALAISGDAAFVGDYDGALAAADQNLANARAQFLAMGKTAEVSALDDLAKRIGQFDETVRWLFPTIIEADRQMLIELANASMSDLTATNTAIIADLERMVQAAQEEASRQREAADHASDVTLWLLLGLGSVALATGTATVVMLVGWVVGPLAGLRASARAITSGNPNARARVFGPEEVASLARDFNEMTDALSAKTEALQESEKRYRLLAENASDIIWTMDMSLRFTYESPSVTRIRGYSPEEAMAQTMEEALTAASLEVATKVLVEELAIEQAGKKDLCRSRTLELEHTCKDGSTVWLEVTTTFLRDEDGRAVGLLGASRDISERKRAEEELEESKRLLENVSQSITEGILLLSKDFEILWANNAVLEETGCEMEQVLGKHCYEITHRRESPCDDHLNPCPIREAQKIRQPVTATHAHFDAAGREHVTEVAAYPVRDEEGEIVQWVHVSRDITERKRAEKALQESEEKYRDLVENINEIIYSVDSNGIITYISPVVEQLGGYTPSEVIGRPFTEFVHPDDILPLMRSFQETVAGNLEPFEYRVLTKSGEAHWVRTSSRPVFEGDRIVGFRAVLTDITERKRAEEAVLRAKEEWERTFDAVPDLIAIIDEHYHIVRANRAMAERLGVTPDECVGKVCYEVVHGLDCPPDFCPHTPSLADGRDYAAEVNEPRLGGEFMVTVTPLVEEQGRRVGSVHVARDITERKRAEEELRRRNEELGLFLDLSRTLASSMEIDGLVETALDSVSMMLPQADVVSVGIYDKDTDALEIRSARGKDRKVRLRMALKPGEATSGKVFQSGKSVLYASAEELAAARADLSPANLQLLQQAAPDEMLLQSAMCSPLVAEGRVLGSLFVATSMADAPFQQTHLALLEAAASHVAVALAKAQLHGQTKVRAITDGLTGLYNRTHFYERLSEETERSGRYDHGFAVVMMDVDNFKKFNDSHGHQMGDEMLRLVADSIRSGLRRSDLAFRYGGDEFAAILLHADAARARAVIDRINRRLAKSLKQMNDGTADGLTLSAGMACFADDGSTPDELVRVADTALYSAKWATQARHVTGQECAIESLAPPPAMAARGMLSTTASSLADALRELGVPDALAELNLRTVATLGTLAEIKDPYIRGHQERTSDVAASLAEEMGLSPERVRGTRLAGLVHDLGKAGVSKRILSKPGKLTEEEFAEIKEHPPLGSMMIISEIEALQQLVPIVRHHHERFDGKGYPDGLAGEEIPLEARILAMVDAFDAMTHERAYRKALATEDALAELRRGAGTQFDPAVVDVFLAWSAKKGEGLPARRQPASEDKEPASVPTSRT